MPPFRWRETGALGMYGRGSRGPTRHVCIICSVVRTRDRVAGAGYACNARPDLHTVCRSFPKISSALSAKVCGGSRSAKRPRLRETGELTWRIGSFVPIASLRIAANTERFGRANQRLGNHTQTLCSRYMAVRIHAVRRRLDLTVSACGTPSPSAIIAYR
jgi:hypothetical protein